MPKGGKRPGAGRKVGSKTQKTAKLAKGAAAEGLSPVEYMLKVMRDEAEDTVRRLDAAKAAAPFIHPRLAPKEVDDGKGDSFKAEDTFL